MAAKIMHEEAQPSTQPVVHASKPLPRIVIVVLGMFLTAPAVAYLSKDWCCAPTSGAIVAAIVIGLVDRFLLISLLGQQRGIRRAQVAVVICCAVGIGFLMKADPNALFQEATSVRPPPGVRHLVIDRNENVPAGGGEQTILLRFYADRATIEEIAKDGQLTRDDATLDEIKTQGGDWSRVWQAAFSFFAESGGHAWTQAAPMKRPVLFRKNSPGSSEFTSLLWDEETGQAFVVYHSG